MKNRTGIFSMRSLGRTLTVLALGATAVAWAQGPGAQNGGPGGGMGMGPHRPPMERALGPMGDHGRWWNNSQAVEKFKLTDSQRKSMDDIFQQHRLTLVDLRGTLEKAELAMEPMIQEDQPDEGKILSQVDRIASARAELEKANARMLFELRKQLSPEQWKAVQAFRSSLRNGLGPGSPDGAARWRGHARGGQAGPGGPDAPPPPGVQGATSRIESTRNARANARV